MSVDAERPTIRIEGHTEASEEFLVDLLTDHGIDEDCIEVGADE